MKTTLDFTPAWAAPVLLLAGIYNILWGGFVVLFPSFMFWAFGMEPPRYPQLWQCTGMIVGVYGIGYIAAATDPLKYWPIILVGFLGKILGPIGFAKALLDGVFPPAFGIVIVFNDLIWWLPFGLLLLVTWDVAKNDRIARANGLKSLPVKKALQKYHTNLGKSIYDHSMDSPVLLVFLRHSGCTFCRETLAELQKKRIDIEVEGTLPILIDMVDDDMQFRRFYQKYHLADLPRIHDSERVLYRSMKLRRGSIMQLFGPLTWIRGFVAGVLGGHGVGSLQGDGLQMSGIFLVHKGRIIRSQRFKSAAEKADLDNMVCSV